MSIKNKLTQVDTALSTQLPLIATSLTNKGVPTTDLKLSQIAGKIDTIPSGGGLEPGSTIPIDMLQPPEETEISKVNKMSQFMVDVGKYILFTTSYTDGLHKFDKSTGEVKYTGFSYCYMCKKIGDKILIVYTRLSTVYLSELDLELKVLNEVSLTAGTFYRPAYSLGIIGTNYYLLLGNSSASFNIIYKIDTTTWTLTSKKINDITGNGNANYLNSIIYNNHIFVYGEKELLKINENLELVLSSTDLKSGSSSNEKNFSIYEHDGFLYTLPYVYSSPKIKKINPEDLTFTDISYEGAKSYDMMYKIGQYVFIYADSVAGTELRIHDLDCKKVTQVNLKNSVLAFTVDGSYLIAEDTVGFIYLFDITNNFESVWGDGILYYKDEFEISNVDTVIDYEISTKFAHIISDKIYLFRRGVYSIDMEPKYTIKAQTLNSMPSVMTYLASKTPTTLEEK